MATLKVVFHCILLCYDFHFLTCLFIMVLEHFFYPLSHLAESLNGVELKLVCSSEIFSVIMSRSIFVCGFGITLQNY